MKKIIYLLLLIQSGFLIAQTKTVVTQFGEKVTINPYVNNGLEANNGYIQLGGALTKPSVLATTPTFTLAFTGLMAGGATDNVLVTDASGVLKSVARSSFGGNDNLGNHIATMDLNMSNKSITNIYNAYIKNDLQIFDRITSNTNYFGLYKTQGKLGIWNNAKSANALTIDENTNTTTLQSAAITKGTDNKTPVPGSVATAADANGNVVWTVTSEVTGVLVGAYNVTGSGLPPQDIPISSTIDDYNDINGLTLSITVTKPARLVVVGSVLVTSSTAGYTGQGSIATFVDGAKYNPNYYSFFDGYAGSATGGLVRLGSTVPVNTVVDVQPGTHTIKLRVRAWASYIGGTQNSNIKHRVNPTTNTYLGSYNEIGAQAPNMTVLVYTK